MLLTGDEGTLSIWKQGIQGMKQFMMHFFTEINILQATYTSPLIYIIIYFL